MINTKLDESTPQSTPVRVNYVLIDQENVHISSVNLLKAEHFRVLIFIGPHQPTVHIDLVLSMQELGGRGKFIKVENPGPNSLDFHISYYLGLLSSHHPHSYFHIISKDTGFDPLLKHLHTRKVYAHRSNSIEDMPCFKSSQPVPSQTPVIIEPAPALETAIKNNNTGLDQKLIMETRIHTAISYLRGMKNNKPSSMKTLTSTIKATLGNEVSETDVLKVVNRLVELRYVKLNGTKLDYVLPPE